MTALIITILDQKKILSPYVYTIYLYEVNIYTIYSISVPWFFFAPWHVCGKKHQSDSEEFIFFNIYSENQNQADITEYYISMKLSLVLETGAQLLQSDKYFLCFGQRLFCLFVFVI